MKNAKVLAWIVILLSAVLMSAPHDAKAAAILELSSGGHTVSVSDGSALDINPFAGAVTYLGSVGDWVINVSTGVSKPSLSPPALDLSSINLTTQFASAPITIRFTDTDFNYTPADFLASIGGTTSGTVSFDAYADVTNVAFGTGVTLASIGPLNGPAFSGYNIHAALPLTSKFSLTEVVTISQLVPGVSSFDANIAPVPEPGTMMLLGTGLVCLAGWGRSRVRK